MSKSVVGLINNRKNKLNNEIILIFNLNPKHTFTFYDISSWQAKIVKII